MSINKPPQEPHTEVKPHETFSYEKTTRYKSDSSEDSEDDLDPLLTVDLPSVDTAT